MLSPAWLCTVIGAAFAFPAKAMATASVGRVRQSHPSHVVLRFGLAVNDLGPGTFSTQVLN
jgi:hypothetical protein